MAFQEWTVREMNLVKRHITLTDEQLAKKLGRTAEAVCSFRKKQGLKKPKDGRGQFKPGNISTRWLQQPSRGKNLKVA